MWLSTTLHSAAHAAHPKTPDQTYEPTYPDRGGSFGIIYAANGPFVERAFRSAVAMGDGFNATLFSDVAGAKACAQAVISRQAPREDNAHGGHTDMHNGHHH